MLKKWIQTVNNQLKTDEHPLIEHQVLVLQHPTILFELIAWIENLEEEDAACWIIFDMCMMQLQIAIDHQHKHAEKLLAQLMTELMQTIKKSKHTLSFWLPVLQAFYEARIELSEDLKDAFMMLASQEEDHWQSEEEALESMRAMLIDLADASDFEVVEHCFSQSHAMSSEFFIDFLADLCALEEGQPLIWLFLLHPNAAIRETVLHTLDEWSTTLSCDATSLTRLKMMQNWCPAAWKEPLKRWILLQRRKGVNFLPPAPPPTRLKCYATEIDGSGAQGLMLQFSQQGKFYLSGMLFKHPIGIKDAWVTTFSSQQALSDYHLHLTTDQIAWKPVTFDYAIRMINHFTSLLQSRAEVPPLHFVELQALLGLTIQPQRLEIGELISELGVQITPFTLESVQAGLTRSGHWFQRRPWTRSWFEEHADIDAWVNQCCHFEKNIRVCNLARACELVMQAVFEKQREKWTFHFLWTALWAQAIGRKNDSFWQDAFFVAYVIQEGRPLSEIPILQKICHMTVLNSVETMKERGSHLMPLHRLS